jgi:hypothetical protein
VLPKGAAATLRCLSRFLDNYADVVGTLMKVKDQQELVLRLRDTELLAYGWGLRDTLAELNVGEQVAQGDLFCSGAHHEKIMRCVTRLLLDADKKTYLSQFLLDIAGEKPVFKGQALHGSAKHAIEVLNTLNGAVYHAHSGMAAL